MNENLKKSLNTKDGKTLEFVLFLFILHLLGYSLVSYTFLLRLIF